MATAGEWENFLSFEAVTFFPSTPTRAWRFALYSSSRVYLSGARCHVRWLQPFLYVWAAPASLLGLSLIPIALFQGGSAAIVHGIVEAHGGIITKLLRVGLLWVGSGAAITLGHVVWGRDRTCLEKSRDHERIHVAQYERWGPFFIPLYLLVSLVAYAQGRDPYLDNCFEREAFEKTMGDD